MVFGPRTEKRKGGDIDREGESESENAGNPCPAIA
jgi:hypothetical protein